MAPMSQIIATIIVGAIILAVVTFQNRRLLMTATVNYDQLLAAVAAQKTVADSTVTLLARIHAELQAAINANDPAKIQALADALQANTQELSDAVVANTDPAAPPADTGATGATGATGGATGSTGAATVDTGSTGAPGSASGDVAISPVP